MTALYEYLSGVPFWAWLFFAAAVAYLVSVCRIGYAAGINDRRQSKTDTRIILGDEVSPPERRRRW